MEWFGSLDIETQRMVIAGVFVVLVLIVIRCFR